MKHARLDILGKIVEKELEIPAFPAVVQRVVVELNDPKTTATRLSDLIVKDQGLTASILKTVSSPFFASRAKISTVSQAVSFLGLKAVRSLVMAVAMRALHQRLGSSAEAQWAHAMGASLTARTLATSLRTVDAEEAFLAGLLHDMGKVVMANEAPERFAETVELADAKGLKSCQAEERVFGFDHADVGALLIKHWRLPDRLAEAVHLHHDLKAAEENSESTMIYVVNLADRICHHLAIGTARPPEEVNFARIPVVRKLGIEQEKLAEVIEQVHASFAQEKAIFD